MFSSRTMAKFLSSITEHMCYEDIIDLNSTKQVLHEHKIGIRNHFCIRRENYPYRDLRPRTMQLLGADVRSKGEEQQFGNRRFFSTHHNNVLHREPKIYPECCNIQRLSKKSNAVPQRLPHHRHWQKNCHPLSDSRHCDVQHIGNQHSWTTLLILLATLIPTGKWALEYLLFSALHSGEKGTIVVSQIGLPSFYEVKDLNWV